MGRDNKEDYVQKVTISIKTPSQTIKLNLDVPEMEVDDLIMAIDAQCENYVLDGDSYEEESDLDSDDFI